MTPVYPPQLEKGGLTGPGARPSKGFGSPVARPRLWEGRKGWEGTIARKPRVEGSGTGGGILLDGGGSPGASQAQPWALQQAEQQAAACTAISLPKHQTQVGPDWPPAPGEPGSQARGGHALPQPARTITHQARAPDYVPLSWLPGQSRA